MQYHAFLIKYAEIGIKGKNRHLFEDALMRQMRYALDRVGEFDVAKEQGRIFARARSDFDFDEVVDALKHVFGISAICPVVITESCQWDDLVRDVIKYVDEAHPDKHFTFKVFARRSDKNYPRTSMQIAADLGAELLDAFPDMKVDVHEPEVEIHVELRTHVYMYSTEIKGLGGMPLGTNGRSMLLLSGGIDSPVAGWMIAKRGVYIDAVYFHAPPYTSERAKQKVVDLARQISTYTGPIRLHVINFTDIQLAIYEKCPHDELTIIMRRYMMRIAQHIARENDCLSLITGESIGQVASQTQQSLVCTNAVCTMPVYRPLIGFDKQDIVDVSERIGTYDTSILPYEDCCTIFVAKHPVTKPRLSVIENDEHSLDEVIDDLLQKAYDSDEVIKVMG